jgi:hypothetical protein
VCSIIAEFWGRIYEEYKHYPDATITKYGLDEKHSNTLKDLYKAAGHRPVEFIAALDKIQVSIDFSIYDPPKVNHSLVKTLHDLNKPL